MNLTSKQVKHQVMFEYQLKKTSRLSQSEKRHLQDVLKMSYQDKRDILLRHLADVQKMS